MTSDYQEESREIEAVSQNDLANRYGFAHQERATKLGKRLNCWYKLIAIELALLIVSFFVYNCLFKVTISSIKTAICGAESCYIDITYVLVIFFAGKVAFVGVFLVMLIWTLRRVSRMQSLRAIHSDKAVLADTMQIVLSTDVDSDRDRVLKEGLRNIFSSSFDSAHSKSKKTQDDDTLINKLAAEVSKILPSKEE
jgi:hypothetical protein